MIIHPFFWGCPVHDELPLPIIVAVVLLGLCSTVFAVRFSTWKTLQIRLSFCQSAKLLAFRSVAGLSVFGIATAVVYFCDGFAVLSAWRGEVYWLPTALAGTCGAVAGLMFYRYLLTRKVKSEVPMMAVVKTALWEWVFVVGSAFGSGLILGVIVAIYRITT